MMSRQSGCTQRCQRSESRSKPCSMYLRCTWHKGGKPIPQHWTFYEPSSTLPADWWIWRSARRSTRRSMLWERAVECLRIWSPPFKNTRIASRHQGILRYSEGFLFLTQVTQVKYFRRTEIPWCLTRHHEEFVSEKHGTFSMTLAVLIIDVCHQQTAATLSGSTPATATGHYIFSFYWLIIIHVNEYIYIDNNNNILICVYACCFIQAITPINSR